MWGWTWKVVEDDEGGGWDEGFETERWWVGWVALCGGGGWDVRWSFEVRRLLVVADRWMLDAMSTGAGVMGSGLSWVGDLKGFRMRLNMVLCLRCRSRFGGMEKGLLCSGVRMTVCGSNLKVWSTRLSRCAMGRPTIPPGKAEKQCLKNKVQPSNNIIERCFDSMQAEHAKTTRRGSLHDMRRPFQIRRTRRAALACSQGLLVALFFAASNRDLLCSALLHGHMSPAAWRTRHSRARLSRSLIVFSPGYIPFTRVEHGLRSVAQSSVRAQVTLLYLGLRCSGPSQDIAFPQYGSQERVPSHFKHQLQRDMVF